MKILKFVFSIGVCFFIAFLGSAITLPSISTWYATLDKPFFSPPNWIFGPVWTTLYFLMGIALYLVISDKKKVIRKQARTAVFVFGVQLIFNLLWSLVFFGLHQPLLAFIVIVALWYSIFMTIKYFYKISKPAAYLLIPYIGWVSFASILNLAIAVLNF